ncbi:MAG: AAA family ATPase [Prevotellaceae bacterium]|jgi:tRNA A37 threonylcarbamoyladenosine biosynthesis protein TsaE|nr:AAA family ATPase [Prevotellaceae bacterium]
MEMNEKKITLTKGQERAIKELKKFFYSDTAKIFIIKGYAGTGKTTLIKEIINWLGTMEAIAVLLASTGRASKILSNITEYPTKTIHGEIYRFNDFNQDLESIAETRELQKIDKTGQLYLTFGLCKVDRTNKKEYFYIIDESSMIGEKQEKDVKQALFGSGQLLVDLLQYDPYGKFIFVGDVCQLPPINETFSPALSANHFRWRYAVEAHEIELTEIVRQKKDNDIIGVSQKIRALYASPPQTEWAKFPLRGRKNIKIFPSQVSMLSDYVQRMKRNGYNNTTLICRSNKNCNTLTSLIRPSLGLTQTTLQKGDLLLVTQNNYISGLMNGDLVEVIDVGIRHRRAQLTFLHVEVKELNTQKVYSQLLIEDILYHGKINLTQEQQKELFVDYYYRMKEKEIKQSSETFRNAMWTDMYLNALRTVYGFALTCHKAQGGEWDHVYLDLSRMYSTPASYQWLYTAITRAKIQLYVAENPCLI